MLWGGQIIRFFPEALYEWSSLALLPFLSAMERIAPPDRQALLDAMQRVPQKTSIWRLSLLEEFDLTTLPLQQLIQPTLILASGADRLLPSIVEARKLQKLIPHAEIEILPNSGHTCLLEAEVNLYQIMQRHHFLNKLPHSRIPKSAVLTNTP
jgi:pimeloyl-ACP methyl ester carboxylesterase